MRLLIPLPLLLACSDYDLNQQTDKNEGLDTSTDSGPSVDTDFSDVCATLSATPHDVPLNEECDPGLQTGSFSPTVEWEYGNSSFCGPPGIGQIVDSNGSGAIDANDLPAIVIYQGGASGSGNGKVVALKGDGSGVYWQTSMGFGQDGGFAIGDLDGDGFPEVVTASTNKVQALDGTSGAVKWTSGILASSLDPLGYNYPSIADMDGDGKPEVTCGNAILNGQTGATIGIGSKGKGAAPYGGTGAGGYYGTLSTPVDLDGDGQVELVAGNAAYDAKGKVVWSNTGLDGLVAVADFDGDGKGEIVKTSGIYITGMDDDGTEVWTKTYAGGNLGAPSIDDFDNDGKPDIVFAATNFLVALDWGGAEKWKAKITDSSGAAGAVLFDFELDGYPEVLYADEQKVRFFSGLDGSIKMEGGNHSSYTILETPTVADVDNDGHVEIVLGHCGMGGATKAFTVYGDASDSWPAGRKTWNEHGYQITNVGDLGEIPSPTPNNFADYNSFRSGDIGQPPGEWYDLEGEVWDVCEDECADGKVYIGGWAMNAGNLEAPAGIPVSLRAGPGGEILETQLTTTAIAPGKTGEPLIFEVEKSKLGGKDPVIDADVDGTGNGVLYECNEDNNTDNWGEKVCN